MNRKSSNFILLLIGLSLIILLWCSIATNAFTVVKEEKKQIVKRLQIVDKQNIKDRYLYGTIVIIKDNKTGNEYLCSFEQNGGTYIIPIGK